MRSPRLSRRLVTVAATLLVVGLSGPAGAMPPERARRFTRAQFRALLSRILHTHTEVEG